MDEEKVILTSSLLHDVGKYISRSGAKMAHQEWGKKIKELIKTPALSEEELKAISDIILFHHYLREGKVPPENIKRLLDIVIQADHITASEREEKDEATNAQRSLLYDIFKLNDEIKFVPRPLFYSSDERVSPYFVVENNKIIPQDYHFGKKDRIENFGNLYYKRIFESFEEDLKKLTIKEFDGWINSLVYIIQNYFQFVASDAYRGREDIPLFEHLKLTASVALSEYRTKGKMRLILIETSGIQKFIAEGKEGEQGKNYAKSMRGRSFFISLLTDAIWRYMRKTLKLYDFNIIRNKGGNLLVISPDYEGIEEKLNSIEDGVNKFLLKNIGDSPSISIESVSIEMDDFSSKTDNFYKKVKTLYKRMSVHKLNKYNRILDSISNMKETFNISSRCTFCGKREATKNNMEYCDLCNSMIEFGKRLMNNINTKIKIKYGANNNVDPHIYFDFGEIKMTYSFDGDADEYILINQYDISEKPFSVQLYPMNNVKETFSEMVVIDICDHKEKLETKLSAFSSDVDNLSSLDEKVLKLKIKEDNKEIDKLLYTPSRYSYYTFLLDYIYTYALLKCAIKNDIYIVFSGGDDTKVVGSFYNILKFSIDFYDELRKLFLDKSLDEKNKDGNRITQSAGIYIASKRFPYKRLMEHAEGELENSKSIKDKISIFGIKMSWEKFKDAVELSKKINELKLSTSLVYDILQISFKYFDGESDEKIINPWPLILYRMRDIKEEDTKNKLIDYIKNFFEYKGDDYKEYLKILIISLKILLILYSDTKGRRECSDKILNNIIIRGD